MLRSSIYVAGVLAIAATAVAQKQTLRSFQRVTVPIKDAGVYHVATGTWTRPASETPSSSALAGGSMDTIYACTTDSGYFGGMDPGHVWTASGRIPSSTAPNVLWNPAALPDGSQPGIAQGCGTSYQIEGFRVAYCTDDATPTVALTVAFFEAWNPPCTSSLSAATPQGGPFAMTGLPGRGTGVQGCWLITLDLAAATASFSMQADGDGVDSGGLPTDGFGWTFTFPSITSTLQATGLLLAGAPSDATGPGTACNPAHPGVGWLQFPPARTDEAAGYDSRRFDDPNAVIGACAPTWPANLSSFAYPPLATTTIEPGGDMFGDDAFRIEGGAAPAPGCYFFGGPASGAAPNGPYANYFLELYAKTTCAPPPPGFAYCAGDGLSSPPTFPCPCGNFGAAGNGCASSFNAAGAHIDATGSIAADTVVLTGTGMQAAGICIFLKGNAVDPNGLQFGDGMTCTGGSLIRLRSVALGSPPNGAQFPVPPETITLSARGGNTVGSGQLASYTVYYRNAAAAFCPPLTFNCANNWQLNW
jgi:hypothetical protein